MVFDSLLTFIHPLLTYAGTIFATRIRLGGRLIAKAETTSTTSVAINEEKEEIKRALNAKFGAGPVASGSGKVSTESSNATSNGNTEKISKTDISWQMVGGSKTQVQK
jgi:hypothetical protein